MIQVTDRFSLWQGQDTLRENQPRPSRLDPYKSYLERRFNAGCLCVPRRRRRPRLDAST
ncbi:hypothetical protein [Streptomyces iranensis]|uniref:hypothetical protein n=1 Tax=Streptomyces iranensis TaxID=576784 RepID=UPI0039B76B36